VRPGGRGPPPLGEGVVGSAKLKGVFFSVKHWVIHPGRAKGVRFADDVRDVLVGYLEGQAENMGVLHPRFECVPRGVLHRNFDATVTASGYPP
jgi:hypothetical protein